jgi:hypothetical protein
MSDEISIDGKEYISSKRASELSAYAQDYIGQLARSGQIDAQRIGGLWYVSMESLSTYKTKADAFKPEPPKQEKQIDPESLISFDGKDYISAARASKITSYHQDYVGQLARSGKILSRQIGNRWYVERDGILAHKKEKDALLAALQSESVGIQRSSEDVPPEVEPAHTYEDTGPHFTYSTENKDLLPAIGSVSEPSGGEIETAQVSSTDDYDEEHSIPIRVNREIFVPAEPKRYNPQKRSKRVRTPRKTMFYGTIAATALTIVIVLSFGFATLKDNSVYTVNVTRAMNGLQRGTLTASAAEAFSRIGDLLESWFVPELHYLRQD